MHLRCEYAYSASRPPRLCCLTLEMSGTRKRAKPAVVCPLNRLVRQRPARLLGSAERPQAQTSERQRQAHRTKTLCMRNCSRWCCILSLLAHRWETAWRDAHDGRQVRTLVPAAASLRPPHVVLLPLRDDLWSAPDASARAPNLIYRTISAISIYSNITPEGTSTE